MLLYVVNFAEIEALQNCGDWAATAQILGAAAQFLAEAASDFLVMFTNTMHRVAAQIEQAVAISLLNIVDTTARKLHRQDVRRVGLLGTHFTMEQVFYGDHLELSASGRLAW